MVLKHVLREGAAWETQTSDLINAVSKKFKPKRIGVRAAKAAEKLKTATGILSPENATTFRALAARANYLALDRPDVSFATKELCRHFASPSRESYEALKRLVRYLVGSPRLVWHFPYQDNTDQLISQVDTDFAGCLSTRRSTSGGVALRGGHLLKHWSVTQTTVTLSSAESELAGICKGSSISLGLLSIAKDLGLHWHLTVETDATAAIGITRRRGLSKIRHLAVADLWVQDRVKAGDFSIRKVAGDLNASDILTKHVQRPLLLRHLHRLNLHKEEGRSSLAPTIEHFGNLE